VAAARRPKAVLTSIDNEPEHLAAARSAFQDARIAPTSARFIAGRAADVLPRMNEAAYDIVLVDADPENVIEYVEHGLRLVRAGGTVLVPACSPAGGSRIRCSATT
jgi:predicted O-methyltransferase YrrM